MMTTPMQGVLPREATYVRGDAPAAGTAGTRLSLRNIEGLGRYLLLRARFRHVRPGLFFIDRGADLQIGLQARIHVGRSVRCMRDFTARWFGEVTIGDNVFFNRGCYVSVYTTLHIGSNCLFGEGVSIHDENHLIERGNDPIGLRGFTVAPIVIGDNVWIGAKATILPGVRIGDGAVIGAHAVVTRDVPAHTVAVGIPARIVREITGPQHPPCAHIVPATAR